MVGVCVIVQRAAVSKIQLRSNHSGFQINLAGKGRPMKPIFLVEDAAAIFGEEKPKAGKGASRLSNEGRHRLARN